MRKKVNNENIIKRIVFGLAIALVILAALIFVAVQAASAGGRLQESDHFGIGNQRFSVDAQVGQISNTEFEDIQSFEASNIALATYSTRDITTALSSIAYKIELAAQAAAEAAKAEELVKANIAKNRRNDHARSYGMPSGLEEVNWDLGKEPFIAEWAMRINRYLLGTPMAGTGHIFAEAAWENGIDPRWSPAISNTESSKGYHCFKSYNAWGWGSSGWGSWEDAIWGHVTGLSNSYGYTITPSAAAKYCPPNSDHWYSATLSEMQRI